MYYYYNPYFLEHHGIKGMKWGVRRYQNPDGSVTSAGASRYYVNGTAGMGTTNGQNIPESKKSSRKNSSESNEKQASEKPAKRKLTDKQKKILIGAGIAAVAVVGGVALYKSGALDPLIRNKADKGKKYISLGEVHVKKDKRLSDLKSISEKKKVKQGSYNGIPITLTPNKSSNSNISSNVSKSEKSKIPSGVTKAAKGAAVNIAKRQIESALPKTTKTVNTATTLAKKAVDVSPDRSPNDSLNFLKNEMANLAKQAYSEAKKTQNVGEDYTQDLLKKNNKKLRRAM